MPFQVGDRIGFKSRYQNRVVWGIVCPTRDDPPDENRVWAIWEDKGNLGYLYMSQITYHEPNMVTPFQQRVQEYLCRTK